MTAKIIPFPVKKKLDPIEEALALAILLPVKKMSPAMTKAADHRDAMNVGREKLVAPDCSFTIYYYDSTIHGKPCAMYYIGRATKPCANYRYKDNEARNLAIAKFIKNRVETDNLKAKYATERKAAGRGMEVGDVLYSTWGYEQTNVDFYLVTGLVGKTMVEICEIGGKDKDLHTSMSGTVLPDPTNITGEPVKKKAVNGRISLTSYSGASKLDFEEVAGEKVYRAVSWSSWH